jgi:predicted ATPase/class 3 adenylate cyclase/DNA-binding CsgD family transcriptional regulator
MPASQILAISLMFAITGHRMLASMSETSWSSVDMGELPTGTVTLLLADVEGSTRLWEAQPEAMKAAVARLDRTLAGAVAAHRGVRPVEQGEGDSFVIAFARAADAVACALDLQRTPLAPIKLRIGVHTGDIQLRDEGNYIGPTINRTARLRDLAHGGQTVLSGATEPLVVDQLPPDVSLTDLGSHPLRDLPRPERVVQLCHPDLHNDFPPLRTANAVTTHNLPVQLTNFVGRQRESANLRETLTSNRLVTLTGTGGAGKTRLAVHVAAELAGEFADGVCYVDLAPITHPDVVPVTAARTLGLPDHPGRSTLETLVRFIRDRQMLVVLDNCEHVLDASAALVIALLGAPRLTVLATSREPLGVSGEATWQVPSLSLADDATALFADRARLAQADFAVTDENAADITEICRRLDGMPLAIELAAARVRSLSLTEIVDSLHDRFRLLTGGSRTAVRRQQTLRASVDWSHALLTETERILFRRVAAFLGGFDLDAAQAVAGDDTLERYQVLDQLALLVDKSLVVAEKAGGRTRYRLLETVRQYALEKLSESGEADAVRSRHRDYYTAMAAQLVVPASADYEQRIRQAETEMDNLRGALGWSLENHDTELALALASSLQPLWWTRNRMLEGRAWFNTVLPDDSIELDVAPAVHAQGLADKAYLDTWVAGAESKGGAQKALTIARQLDDPVLLARVLTACGFTAGYTDSAELAPVYFAEAADLARALDDRWTLIQILSWQANTAETAGYPIAAARYAEEGYALAEAIGDRSGMRLCRLSRGWAGLERGDVVAAGAHFGAAIAEAEAVHDDMLTVGGLMGLTVANAHRGDVSEARRTADSATDLAAELDAYFRGLASGAVAIAALAEGDLAAAKAASDASWQHLGATHPELARMQLAHFAIQVALTSGDLVMARRKADDAVEISTGWHLVCALLARARVAAAQGEPGEAERDAHEALSCALSSGARLPLPDILECLAGLAGEAGNLEQAARLFGATEAVRQRMGIVRFRLYDADYESSVSGLRNSLGENGFDAAWAEGAALSTDEAIAYAQRGRGERKRASSGWASLTRAELDVVKLVSEGLGNKDVAARLFVSPRTVQAHLTHIYTKLGLTSRVQLAQAAARRG